MKNKCFIIAELSANHGNDINIVLDTVRAVKRSGADAIKIQTYKADTITIDSNKNDFIIEGGTIWDGKTLYNLYKEASLPWEWHKKIFDLAKELDMICFSSPFDNSAVDFLETLNNPIYKIASFEITDIPLIEYIAKKGKPIIISTGIADFEDIKLAIDTCKKVGNYDITLLKCTSSYPAPVEEADLIMIKRFVKDFKVKVGLSDHTLGIIVPITAVAMGATVIEKHFILNKNIGGPDSSFSLDENEFTQMVKAVRIAEKSIGVEKYDLTLKQKDSRRFSRSLYAIKDIKKGERFTEKNIKSIRPGYGLHPKFYGQILGSISKLDIEKGDRITKNSF
tara:strand:+ start:13211 stop:14221 length:1011 start_codon:yes stop_codon:yes gene_type:complete